MTGFGSGSAPAGEGRVVVDVRTVNHRYIDVRMRGPQRVQEFLPSLERMVRKRVQRGRADVTVRLEGQVLPPPVLSVARAKAAIEQLAQLRDEVAPTEPVPLSVLGVVPELFSSQNEDDSAPIAAALTQAATQACDVALEMRKTEGALLEEALRRHITQLRAQVAAMEARAPVFRASQAERLRERVQRLLIDTETTLDGSRLEQEIAILADRSDVEEELTRLHSHAEHFEGFLSKGSEPIGKRLDFLAQEMAREANTIGSKAPDAELTTLVVELKATVEQMREQVQNVV